MKALVYNGPRGVRVKEVPDAKLERPTDVLVKITTTNICGSDLHMFEDEPTLSKARCVFRSTSVADSAKTASAGSPGFASPSIPGTPAARMGMQAWAPSTAASRVPARAVQGFQLLAASRGRV